MKYNINNTMKAIYHIKASLLTLAAMVACTEMDINNESQDSTNNGLLQELSITGKDFQFENATRSSVTIGENGASFTWDEDDVIGIFPDKGDQVSFAMDEGAGTQTATFSGGGWALKSSSKYAAYYPHVYENRDLTKIPVSYVGQTQNGNANTDHIGTYDFMAAGVSTPENGAVAFDMQHLGALVQLTVTVPEPSTLTKVVLTSTTEFTQTGTIDLTSDKPSITAKTQSKKLEITLKDVTTTEKNETVIVYFMIAPINLSDCALTTTIYFEDGSYHIADLEGKNFSAGMAYRLSVNIEKTLPHNQIWYTNGSTANTESPNTSSAFSASIVSNTYDAEKGCWVMTFDNDITTIGNNAFLYDNITSIIIPESITTIGNYAFACCKSLKKITIPNSVNEIGEFAFEQCLGMTSFTIPEGVTTIGSNAFGNNENLRSITLPSTINSIPEFLFSRCKNLQEIVVSEANQKYDSREGCNAIIETATDKLIAGCTSTIIPNSVTSIGNRAFFYSTGLISVDIPDNITSIGNECFEGCTNITCVKIGNGVTSINYQAFYGCSSLSEVYSYATTPPSLGSDAFAECKNLKYIYVPIDSRSSYQSKWMRYSTLIRGI